MGKSASSTSTAWHLSIQCPSQNGMQPAIKISVIFLKCLNSPLWTAACQTPRETAFHSSIFIQGQAIFLFYLQHFLFPYVPESWVLVKVMNWEYGGGGKGQRMSRLCAIFPCRNQSISLCLTYCFHHTFQHTWGSYITLIMDLMHFSLVSLRRMMTFVTLSKWQKSQDKYGAQGTKQRPQKFTFLRDPPTSQVRSLEAKYIIYCNLELSP